MINKKERAYEILDKAQYGVVSMARNNEAYGIPMSIARLDNNLYFHTGKNGKKIEFLNANPRVSISVVGKVEVPDLYNKDQIEEMVADPDRHGKFVNTVFTTSFESVIVNGHAELLVENEEKVKAMRVIYQKYTPDMMDYFNIPIERSLDMTSIYKISLDDFKLRSKAVKV